VSGLDSTSGIVALAAAALALAALVLAAVLFAKLRQLRAAQRVVLGEGGGRDLVAQATQLEDRVAALDDRGRADAAALAERLSAAEARLDRTLSHSAVVRYDSYGEMSGRQSSSIALLDDLADGVLVSSILHREQARVYAKQVSGGDSELGISPEEREAIDAAMAARGDSSSPAKS
jgi:Protein of unknown function (DUF4446)